MAFLLIEDLYGTMEAVIFPTVYAKYSNVIKTGEILKIEGKISLKEGEKPKILVSTLKEMTRGVKKIYIKINEDMDEKEALDKVVSNVITTDGSIPIYLYFEEKDELKLLSKKWWTEIDDNLENHLKEVFGEGNVKFC